MKNVWSYLSHKEFLGKYLFIIVSKYNHDHEK